MMKKSERATELARQRRESSLNYQPICDDPQDGRISNGAGYRMCTNPKHHRNPSMRRAARRGQDGGMASMKRRPKPKRKLRKVWHDRDYRLEFAGNVWHLDVAQWSEPGNPMRGELRVYRVQGDVSNMKILDRAILRLAKHRGLGIIHAGDGADSLSVSGTQG